jgi:superfamily I DNA/RNA helicase/very-short-patch-repair endonuclease
MAQPEDREQTQDRAIRLFAYLQELVQLRAPQVRDVERYEAVIWFSEIPHEDGCYGISWGAPLEDSDIWLEVRKRKEPSCPTPPASCKEWIESEGLYNSGVEPTLMERIFVPNRPNREESNQSPTAQVPDVQEGRWVLLVDRPEVLRDWENYLNEKWRPWADKHQRWNSVQSLYGRLFTVFQLQRGLGESYEFMLGAGLLCWVTPSGQMVRRHILAGQASLEFDSNTGILSVRPAADGVKLGFEMEMLEPSERPNPEQLLALERALEQTAESPWDRRCIEPILRGWVHSLHPAAVYEPADEKPISIDHTPRLVYAPAIFLRKRSARSLVGAFRIVIEQMKRGEEIPFGVKRLLELESGSTQWITQNAEPTEREGRDGEDLIHFPLAANEEQREIVERMTRDQGVLVQGPPGTGKSHTIANLICHLLASGKRILVTSHTPRALKVLRGKIPKDLLPLGVSLLGNDRDSLKGLEESVHGITNQYHRWNPKSNETRINQSQKDVYELKKRRAVIDGRLRELREKDTFIFKVAKGVYQGTALQIAQQVSAQSALHHWIPDQIGPDAEPPLTKDELRRLLEAHRALDAPLLEELKKRIPPLEEIPNIGKFLQLCENEARAATALRQFEKGCQDPLFSPISAATSEAQQVALRCLKDLLTEVESIVNRPLSWLQSALRSFLAGQDLSLRQLQELSGQHLKGLTERAQLAHLITIEIPSTIDRRKLRADATDFCDHLKRGGSLGWGPFRKAVVKQALYIINEARVNGRPCKTPQALEELLLRLEVESTISLLWDAWRGLAERNAGPLPRQAAQLAELHESLAAILALKPKLNAAKMALAALGNLPDPKWHDADSIAQLISILYASLAAKEVRKCSEEIEKYSRILRTYAAHPQAHPVVPRAIAALESRDSKEWGSIVAQIEKLKRSQELQKWRLTKESELAEVTPHLARHLRDSAADSAWDDRIPRIDETWNWARADAWLREYEREHNVRALEADRQAVEIKISREIGLLAAARAWRHCFERMTEEHRSYLEAWRKEIQRIGKGTGKYAEMHRRTAQKYMNKCRAAIPAWIMPFYRVAETVQPRKECFDVVIVDEASQSGPEALLLQYLAKQVVIVGDDQQISPEDVGIDQSQVHALQRRYLHDFGLKETFGTGYSLFAQAEIRYGNRIPLREHFRCMPEIIRFSNDLCYSANPLIPLRQYPPKRLDPVVVRFVPEGFREGGSQSARNQPEAEALVQAICDCCASPAYDGKAMGVISLQGDYQAGLIQRLLKDRLGEQEMLRREIICGDAYAFQGDERDVVFMSMVAAPNERIGALTKEADKRRFNVAASRAKDQVWLFHTATLNDLNQEDLRFKLLSYYENPGQSPIGAPDWSRCESQFERDVGQQITARGYRVVVQFEPLGAGGKRIDLVVEGEKTRLAIECDGDRWHGPDEYEKDMFRQRQLERAGLVFWRIRGSEFYRNTSVALASLWEKLHEMRIEPWGVTRKETEASISNSTQTPQPNVAELLQPTVANKPARGSPLASSEEHTSSIREISREQVRSLLHACIPDGHPIPREELLHDVARKLGYAKLGHNIRSTINRIIGAEVRAGRLGTDWQKVWKAENST